MVFPPASPTGVLAHGDWSLIEALISLVKISLGIHMPIKPHAFESICLKIHMPINPYACNSVCL